MKTIYGIDVDSCEDEYITVSERVMATVSEVARPGAVLVDVFPIRQSFNSPFRVNTPLTPSLPIALVKLIPSWVPGAFYQKLAKQLTRDVHEMREAPFAVAKRKMVRLYDITHSNFYIKKLCLRS